MKDLQSDRVAQGKQAGLIGIIFNTVLATGKLTAGIIASSTAIISDALNNFTDGISSVITMIGFRLSQKPADEDHPYGHARFEYLSSFIISFLVLFVGFELIKTSVEKIISPQETHFNLLVAIILAVSVLTKLALWWYNAKMAKKLNADVLRATAVDCRNDAIITTVVLISSVVEYYTSVRIDGYVGLLLSLFISYGGIKLVKETISPLLGNKNNQQLKDEILAELKNYPIVIGYHDLMIHDYGPDKFFVSIHFEIDKNHDPLYVHEIIDKFEREFLRRGIMLTVHYDPVVTDSAEINRLKHQVANRLIRFDNRLSMHDFRCVPCDGFVKAFLDIPLPCDMENKRGEIVLLVEDALNEGSDCRYCAEITFDSISFN